jgi:hypothetical protein
MCGVWVVELVSGKTVAFLRFDGAVQEIFAIQILPKTQSPELLEQDDPLVSQTYVLPDESLKDVNSNAFKGGSPRATNSQSAPADMLPTGY